MAYNSSEEILTGLNQDEIEKKLVKCNDDFDSFFRSRRNELIQDYQMFREFYRVVKNGKASQTTEVYNKISTALPFINSAVQGKSQVVEAVANFDDPDHSQSRKITKIVNHLILNDNSRGHEKIVLSIQNMLWGGNGIAKAYMDENEYANYNPDSELGYDEVVSPKPNFKTINIFDFAVDPNTTSQNFDDIEWARDRVYVTKGELYMLREQGLCKFDDADLNNNQADPLKSSKYIRDKTNGYNSSKSKKFFYDEFYFDHVYKTEDGTYKKIRLWAWLLNNKKLIKLEINRWGKKPYVTGRCISYDKEFWGLGFADVLSTFVAQLSQINNHTGYLVDKSGKRMLLHVPGNSGLNSLSFRDIENGILAAKSIDANAMRTEPTDVDRALTSLVNYNTNYLAPKTSDVTGVTPIMQGFSAGDTATESTIINNNSFARLSTIIDNFLNTFIVELAGLYFMLLKNQVASNPAGTPIYIDGENITLTPEDFLEGNYSFKAIGSVDQANKNLRARQIGEYMAQVTGILAQRQVYEAAGMDVNDFIMSEINPLYGINKNYFKSLSPINENLGNMTISEPSVQSVPETPLSNSGVLENENQIQAMAQEIASANKPIV